MRDMNQYFPSTRLKAPDLRGNVATVVISNITEQEFDDKNAQNGKKVVPELHFQGKDKTFLLNVTNRNELVKHFGGDGDLWLGKTIQLHPAKGKNQQGGIIDAILVGVPSGPAQAAPQPQSYAGPNPMQDQRNGGCSDPDDFSDIPQDDDF